jgi:hypothetical protein
MRHWEAGSASIMTSRQRVAAFRIATVANVLWWLLEITQIGRTLPTWSIIGPVLGMRAELTCDAASV